jgi:hypothetical protein
MTWLLMIITILVLIGFYLNYKQEKEIMRQFETTVDKLVVSIETTVEKLATAIAKKKKK